jgi:hypothetical protein
MSHIVYIQNYLPSIVATRSSISNLKEQVDIVVGDSYVFDFNNVLFISRSFADELLKYFNSSKIQWKVINANSNITAMIDAVSHTQLKASSDYDDIAITSFSNDKDLMNFLATI